MSIAKLNTIRLNSTYILKALYLILLFILNTFMLMSQETFNADLYRNLFSGPSFFKEAVSIDSYIELPSNTKLVFEATTLTKCASNKYNYIRLGFIQDEKSIYFIDNESKTDSIQNCDGIIDEVRINEISYFLNKGINNLTIEEEFFTKLTKRLILNYVNNQVYENFEYIKEIYSDKSWYHNMEKIRTQEEILENLQLESVFTFYNGNLSIISIDNKKEQIFITRDAKRLPDIVEKLILPFEKEVIDMALTYTTKEKKDEISQRIINSETISYFKNSKTVKQLKKLKEARYNVPSNNFSPIKISPNLYLELFSSESMITNVLCNPNSNNYDSIVSIIDLQFVASSEIDNFEDSPKDVVDRYIKLSLSSKKAGVFNNNLKVKNNISFIDRKGILALIEDTVLNNCDGLFEEVVINKKTYLTKSKLEEDFVSGIAMNVIKELVSKALTVSTNYIKDNMNNKYDSSLPNDYSYSRRQYNSFIEKLVINNKSDINENRYENNYFLVNGKLNSIYFKQYNYNNIVLINIDESSVSNSLFPQYISNYMRQIAQKLAYYTKTDLEAHYSLKNTNTIKNIQKLSNNYEFIKYSND